MTGQSKFFGHRVLCFEDAAATWLGDPLMLVGRSFVLSIWKTVVAVFLVVRDFDAGVSQ